MNSRNPCTGKCDWTGVVVSTQPTTGNVEHYPMCKTCGSFVVGSTFIGAQADPADAGMREALKAAQECIARETTRCIRLEQTIRDTIQSLERGSTSAPVVECLKAALTAPGATTKSDGGAKAGSSPILANKEEQRAGAHGMTPVGIVADAAGCTDVGPSDPSSTRSEVTVEECARRCADELVVIVEAATKVARRTGNTFVMDRQKVATMIAGHFAPLLDQFEIRRKK